MCPMHPEIVRDQPGACPECGMRLVVADDSKTHAPINNDRGLGELTWKNYLPLVAILAFILLITVSLSWVDYQADFFTISRSISYFMGGFFTIFSIFKLLDLKGFAEGYSTYDLLAQKVFAYGYIYPFIELGFGVAMFVGVQASLLLWSEVAVMVFSGLGVVRKLMQKEKIKCVCLGTFLKVPLTSITLIEDFGMAVLALALLFL